MPLCLIIGHTIRETIVVKLRVCLMFGMLVGELYYIFGDKYVLCGIISILRLLHCHVPSSLPLSSQGVFVNTAQSSVAIFFF